MTAFPAEWSFMLDFWERLAWPHSLDINAQLLSQLLEVADLMSKFFIEHNKELVNSDLI